MNHKRNSILLSTFFLVLLFGTSLFAEDSGKIGGKVIDASTREPMIAANIIIEGTSLGNATGLDGTFIIQSVPPGIYKIKASYIGYTSVEKNEVAVIGGQTTYINLELIAVGITTDAVIVTTQAQGQNQAINQQLAADKIMNVVSSARIQELPDANAAESIGRLPGVSIQRQGGEGNQVVIRGLQPKYNAIMVDGVRMASSNNNDRSADLSMISSNMLDGIEVLKTVTPDQDGDVLGGTVNFRLREAKGEKEGLGIELLGEGGYNNLPDAYNKYRNYKYVGSVEGRLLNQKFGVFVQGDVERRNLTSNELSASYEHGPLNYTNSSTDYAIKQVNLDYYPRDRQRMNGTIVLDYRLPEGKISFSNLLSTSTTETDHRQEQFIIDGGSASLNDQHFYTYDYSKSKLSVLSNTLNIEDQLSMFHVNAKLAHTYSETDNPGDWTVNFAQHPSGLSTYLGKTQLDPGTVIPFASVSLDSAMLNSAQALSSFTRERALTISLDIDMPINFSNAITSTLKFGGKYKHQTRSYTYDDWGSTAQLNSPSASAAGLLIIQNFNLPSSVNPTTIPIKYFIDPNFNYGTFLNGDYKMSNPMSRSMMEKMLQLLRDSSAGTNRFPEAYAHNNFTSTANNYSGNEILTAFYVMETINFGSVITIIPGVRYQNLQTTYTGVRGIQTSQAYRNYIHHDTTFTLEHPFWLPDVNMRIKPFTWFDIRLAYSTTLSYPDFTAIIPEVTMDNGFSVSYNNYQLVPTQSKNYDAYLSFSDNTIGLFTAGGFYKKIENLIYRYNFNLPDSLAQPYLPGYNTTGTGKVYAITTYVNDPYKATVYGLEFDWQTHLWYLPNPFKGLVFNINFTHIYSKAEYPYKTLVTPPGRGSRSRIVDTSYIDPLLDQPNNIVNLSIGYDYRGFSIRVSMLYKDEVFQDPSYWQQNRSITAAYKRWDISVKQDLPFPGLQVYCNLNNLNNAQDFAGIQAYPTIPVSEQEYAMTVELGLRWQL